MAVYTVQRKWGAIVSQAKKYIRMASRTLSEGPSRGAAAVSSREAAHCRPGSVRHSDSIRARIEPLGGVELEIAPRETIREPVNLDT
jgi:hypothetical protein